MEKVANIGDIVGAEEKLGKNRERDTHKVSPIQLEVKFK